MSATRTLHAGPTEALLDGIDLRYVRARRGVEAVRRVYVAVRDQNWNTIPGAVSDHSVWERDDGFEVTFTCRHAREELDFVWEGSIVGKQDGAVTYRMDGRAESEFEYNRIGFCILHPVRTTKGAHYRGVTPDGPVDGEFPDLIGPQRFQNGHYAALTPAVSSLEVVLTDNSVVRLRFEGDLFEMEDQRNWTDASQKTYCTPLALGYPHRARRGQVIRQDVRIAVQAPTRATESASDVLVLGGPVGVAGAVGLGAPTHVEPFSERQVRLVRALEPAHLRADVHLADLEHRAALRRGLDVCTALQCPLELALYLVESDTPTLTGIAEELAGARVARVLVYAADATSPSPRETTPAGLVASVRDGLRLGDDVPVGGGTDMYFCELNRTRPSIGTMDVVAWSVNPQVHAFDERSIMETPPAQSETVRTARSFAGDAALAVTPITLKPRYNVNATRARAPAAADELPESVDPRQATQFAAAWTVASLGALLRAGVASATYFEPTGWRGLVESETGCPLPSRFPSRPGQAFPVYHVLADLAGRSGDELLDLHTSDELRLAGLALRGPAGLRLLAANLTSEEIPIRLAGLPDGDATLRQLDDRSGELAGTDPDAFRRDTEPVKMRDGALELTLAPHAVATLDIPRGAT